MIPAAAVLPFSFAKEATQDLHNFDTFAKGRNKGWDRERCLRCSPNATNGETEGRSAGGGGLVVRSLAPSLALSRSFSVVYF